jgi:hypothetical protein
MDPYLEDEKLWPAFHHLLVSSLYQILLPGLVDRYRARIACRQYSTQLILFTSITPVNHVEEYIEIRQRTDNRLVTLIDVASPTNKTTTDGREAYLNRRAEARTSNANIVEIDLVLQGSPLLEYSRDGLPDWDYAITVTRSLTPDKYEIYTGSLQKRLPRFKIPLASDDRDTVLDMQATFARSFDAGNFGTLIKYDRDPVVRLKDADKIWLDELLKLAKLR